MLVALELILLAACVVLPRCWNLESVFAGQDVYFTDADCYSRMTRVRLCWEHPGTIVRHHEFENFPRGTSAHTTAPFDYAIVIAAVLITPFTANPVDTAGAWISPVVALAGALFLWWWCRRVKFHYRWPALLLYATSPILVHGTLLGRPDHQSLLILLVTIALGAEVLTVVEGKRRWQIVAGLTWGFALWVSFYEPLLLFVLTRVDVYFLRSRSASPNRSSSFRLQAWLALGSVLMISFIIERRLPDLGAFSTPLAGKWAQSIGELSHVQLVSLAWWSWGSFLLLAAPALYFLKRRRDRNEAPSPCPVRALTALLLCALALTVWQVRWAYFFVLIFVLLLPMFLEGAGRRWLVWLLVVLCFWPVAKAWDETLWPNDDQRAAQLLARQEGIDLRALATEMRSPQQAPFLAPWWLSPALAYWSGQPGVAGSSHESLPGNEASARFFSATDAGSAEDILRRHGVIWVVAYDADRTARISSEMLGAGSSAQALAFQLDRAPSRAPAFLMLKAQTSSAKLYQVVNNL